MPPIEPTSAANNLVPSALPEANSRRLDLVQTLLDAALQAQRIGTFDDLVRQRPLATRWLVRRHGRIIRATLGDEIGGQPLLQSAAWLLRWLVVQLRPDGAQGLETPGEDAWLRLPGWRPFLAVAAASGLLHIPDFPRHYRRQSNEAPIDNLCGLWNVGPSTVYRLLERTRRTMAQTWATELDGVRSLSLRTLVFRAVDTRLQALGADAQRTWHLKQTLNLQDGRDAGSVLWHLLQAADVAGFIRTLRKFAGPLAVWPETESLLGRLDALRMTARERVDLWLARAALERTRKSAERELTAYQQARQVAQQAEDRLLLGIVHSALGRYYDSRDADQSLACYQDSAEFLRELGPERGDTEALGHFVITYARLAWLFLLRNDARSKAVLDRAEVLRAAHALPDEALGLLEQAWGEYWHRAGERQLSIEHRFRALNIFERIGDERSVHSTSVSIAHDLAARGERVRAQRFLQRTLAAADAGRVGPETAVAARLNLGVILCDSDDYTGAIEHGEIALQQSLTCGLRLHAFNTRYNLAEAHYKRFRQGGQPQDEQAGDAHVELALASPVSDISPAAFDLIRSLKSQVLGAQPISEPNRLLPSEDAVHFDQMSEVHRCRKALSVPGEPCEHAQAHLAIARAYLAISTKEREAALALIHKHGLQGQFAAEFEELKQTFQRELTREQHLADAWKRAAADVVDDTRRAPLIAHLVREGSINKSAYVELCGVSPATASKHLGLLAERGLLVQKGKGPSTRYELPG